VRANLYATNTGDSRILRIPLQRNGDAGRVQIFADGPTIDARQHTTDALHGADGLALDIVGNFYVAANQVGEVQVISPGGRLIARYAGAGSTELDFPATLVFKGSRLFLTNASLFALAEFFLDQAQVVGQGRLLDERNREKEAVSAR
jgi:sugar lactone lactonase YvrE